MCFVIKNLLFCLLLKILFFIQPANSENISSYENLLNDLFFDKYWFFEDVYSESGNSCTEVVNQFDEDIAIRAFRKFKNNGIEFTLMQRGNPENKWDFFKYNYVSTLNGTFELRDDKDILRLTAYLEQSNGTKYVNEYFYEKEKNTLNLESTITTKPNSDPEFKQQDLKYFWCEGTPKYFSHDETNIYEENFENLTEGSYPEFLKNKYWFMSTDLGRSGISCDKLIEAQEDNTVDYYTLYEESGELLMIRPKGDPEGSSKSSIEELNVEFENVAYLSKSNYPYEITIETFSGEDTYEYDQINQILIKYDDDYTYRYEWCRGEPSTKYFQPKKAAVKEKNIKKIPFSYYSHNDSLGYNSELGRYEPSINCHYDNGDVITIGQYLHMTEGCPETIMGYE